MKKFAAFDFERFDDTFLNRLTFLHSLSSKRYPIGGFYIQCTRCKMQAYTRKTIDGVHILFFDLDRRVRGLAKAILHFLAEIGVMN